MKELINIGSLLSGYIRAYLINPDNEIVQYREQPNLIMASACDIVSKLLTGNSQYAINTVYMEFATAGNETPPSYTNTSNSRGYYDNLDGTTKDYLRQGLADVPTLDSTGVPYINNIATFFSLSGGASVGQHGLAFDTSSLVTGFSLVASPSEADTSLDIVLARTYLDDPLDLSIGAGYQVAIRWELTLTSAA